MTLPHEHGANSHIVLAKQLFSFEKYFIELCTSLSSCHMPSLHFSPSTSLLNHDSASVWKACGKRPTFRSIGPRFLKNCTYAPSINSSPAARFSWYSSRRRGVKPQFLLTMIFWRPGNLYWERRRASMAVARSWA